MMADMKSSSLLSFELWQQMVLRSRKVSQGFEAEELTGGCLSSLILGIPFEDGANMTGEHEAVHRFAMMSLNRDVSSYPKTISLIILQQGNLGVSSFKTVRNCPSSAAIAHRILSVCFVYLLYASAITY